MGSTAGSTLSAVNGSPTTQDAHCIGLHAARRCARQHHSNIKASRFWADVTAFSDVPPHFSYSGAVGAKMMISLQSWMRSCNWCLVRPFGFTFTGFNKSRTPSFCCHQPLFFIRKLEWLFFHVVSKYQQYVLSFCYKALVWQTDGQTELRINDPQYRTSIAAIFLILTTSRALVCSLFWLTMHFNFTVFCCFITDTIEIYFIIYCYISFM